MANYVIPEAGEFDVHKQVKCKGRVWTDEELEELLGPDFEVMILKSDDRIYVEKGWDTDDVNVPVNGTATSLADLRIKGSVLICGEDECRRL